MTQTPARPRLGWGPFAVGTFATVVFALFGGWMCDLSRGHWWFLPLAIVVGLATLILALSAGAALFDRGGQR